MKQLDLPGLVCFWEFGNPAAGSDLTSRGPHRYRLREHNGPINRAVGGPLGGQALDLRRGQWLSCPRAECPGLDLHGADAQVTVVAWLLRRRQDVLWCDAIAGMWNERYHLRQYCLFVGLRIDDLRDSVNGHVSLYGGNTTGHPGSDELSVGRTAVPWDTWVCCAFTYDGSAIRSYLDGRLDATPRLNPRPHSGGIFHNPEFGSDFTIGAVDLPARRSEYNYDGERDQPGMGNFFDGLLAGVAVYRRALNDDEVLGLSRLAAPAP